MGKLDLVAGFVWVPVKLVGLSCIGRVVVRRVNPWMMEICTYVLYLRTSLRTIPVAPRYLSRYVSYGSLYYHDYLPVLPMEETTAEDFLPSRGFNAVGLVKDLNSATTSS